MGMGMAGRMGMFREVMWEGKQVRRMDFVVFLYRG